MKRIFKLFGSLLLAASLTACTADKLQPPPVSSSEPQVSQTAQAADTSSEEQIVESANEQTEKLLIRLTDEAGKTIIFSLNDSSAAKSLYNQLPLSPQIENYSNNEKIFYPPNKLDTNDTPLAKGPAGTLAYYEPWGDVAIYYGDCGGANGLYMLGQAISGAEHISTMGGLVKLEAVDSASSSSGASSTINPTVSKPDNQPASISPPSLQKETNSAPALPKNDTESKTANKETVNSMQVKVGNKTFTAALAENEAASAFAELMKNAPVVINMSDYSGFEKVGSLPIGLPISNSSITAVEGDIILYNGNQIVVFYGSNSWSYTRLGKIDDLSGWKEALGDGDVTITFSIE